MSSDNDQIVFILLGFDPITINLSSANSSDIGEWNYNFRDLKLYIDICVYTFCSKTIIQEWTVKELRIRVCLLINQYILYLKRVCGVFSYKDSLWVLHPVFWMTLMIKPRDDKVF